MTVTPSKNNQPNASSGPNLGAPVTPQPVNQNMQLNLVEGFSNTARKMEETYRTNTKPKSEYRQKKTGIA